MTCVDQMLYKIAILTLVNALNSYYYSYPSPAKEANLLKMEALNML